MNKLIGIALVLLALGGSVLAATPPDRIHYQGVLRDSGDNAIDGTRDMVFRFYDADLGGSEILVDAHEAAGSGAVTVTSGLFGVKLGGGTVSDGGGAGVYTSLADVFADYADVWISIEVEAEVLSPRVQVIASGYALNAGHLGGKTAAEFVDTSAALQTKAGTLQLSGSLGVESSVYDITGTQLTVNDDLYVSGGNVRVNAGDDYAKYCMWGSGDSNYCIGMASGQSFGYLSDFAMTFGMSNTAGRGWLWRDTSDAASDGAMSLTTDGRLTVKGYSNFMSSVEMDGVLYVDVANPLIRMRDPSGLALAQWFTNDASDYTYLYDYQNSRYFIYSNANGVGIGTTAPAAGYALTVPSLQVNDDFEVGGGSGSDNDFLYFDAGAESLAWDNTDHRFELSDDVYATGTGRFTSSVYVNSSGPAYRLYDSAGSAQLSVVYANDASNYTYFYDSQNSRYLTYSNATGIGLGTGSTSSAYAVLTPSLWASNGASYGIRGDGATAGGYFTDTNSTAYADVAVGTCGGNFRGDTLGVRGYDLTDSTYAYLANGTSSTQGNGTKNFVQNHPYNDDEIIVYSAPEGNEVATYTRGTARLTDGEARIALDETFAWVTNPDIGLTAHITPRDDAVLYVASLSATELVVRAGAASAPDAMFDYMVWGLRIGFEDVGVIQEKGEDEARIPSMASHRERHERRPEWRRHTALERYKNMRVAAGISGPLDLSASIALRNAIEEYDPAIHGQAGRPEEAEMQEASLVAGPAPDLEPEIGGGTAVAESGAPTAQTGRASLPTGSTLSMDDDGNAYARSFRPSSTDMAEYHPVTELVERGDVVVIDPATPGALRLGDEASDPGVMGIVAGEPGVLLGGDLARIESVDPELAADLADARETGNTGAELAIWEAMQVRFEETHAPIALIGTVRCKVDAGYGSIRPGDLLTVSPTPGHAMRADDPRPGTILGKAVGSLDVGAGLIEVIVMLR